MNSKEFLRNKLVGLTSKYPSTTIKYFFDAFDNDHFVGILPKSDLESIIENEAMDIDKVFLEQFPTESLSFIEIDETLEFDELVYEHKPNVISEFKRINLAKVLKQSSAQYSEKMPYLEPLYLTRKIAKEDVVILKEEDEFAFAA